MPKATLEFNLPEEQAEFETTNNAGTYAAALTDIANLFRRIRKYNYLIADPEWTTQFGEVKDEFQGVYQDRIVFFEKLDSEFLEILRDVPGI